MVGRPPGKSCGWSRAQPYSLEISLSRAEDAEKGAPRGIPASQRTDAAKCGKLSLALACATGCNSLKRPHLRTNHGGGQSGELPDARDDRFRSEYQPNGRARARPFDTA